MKSVLKGFVTIVEYIFYRISEKYDDDASSGGGFMGFMLWGFVMQPILYLNNIPVITSVEVGSAVLPTLLGSIIGATQKKRYERLREKYKYEEIENPFYELCGLLVFLLVLGSILLGIYVMQFRPLIPTAM